MSTENNLESRYTEPSLECPNPEWWHSTDDQSTEDEVTELIGSLVRALQPEYSIETGSCIGNTTLAIGRALKKNNHGFLDSIEIDYDLAQRVSYLTRDLPVHIYNTNSLKFVPNRSIDFAFFDSDFDTRIKEFKYYYPDMTHRTIVAFHDTGPQHPLMVQIKEHLNDYIDYINLPTPRGLLIGRVIKIKP